MKINVKLMTEEAYITLQKNHNEVYQKITENPNDSTWLKDYLGFEPFEEKKYVIDDFQLLYSDKYNEVAEKNAITLYEAIKDLPRHISCNNRFWAWILFTKFYKQAQKVLKLTESSLITRWLIGNSRRSLMLGVVSRYYFKIEVAIDEDFKNYELGKFLIQNHTPYKNISYRNIGMLNNVVIPYIKICKEMNEKYNVVLDDYFCSTVMKETSKLGSVMLIDIISKQEVYDKLFAKIKIYFAENYFKIRSKM